MRKITRTIVVCGTTRKAGATTVAVNVAAAAAAAGLKPALLSAGEDEALRNWCAERSERYPTLGVFLSGELTGDGARRASERGAELVVIDAGTRTAGRRAALHANAAVTVVVCGAHTGTAKEHLAALERIREADPDRPMVLVFNRVRPDSAETAAGAPRLAAALVEGGWRVLRTRFSEQANHELGLRTGRSALEWDPEGAAGREAAELAAEVVTMHDVDLSSLLDRRFLRAAGKGSGRLVRKS